MARIQYRVQPDALQSLIDDPERGIISLVGDHGGLSLITGEIAWSSLVPGTMSVELEHGTVYLDPGIEITVSEDDGKSLQDRSPGSLYELNTVLTSFLANELDWRSGADDADADDRDEALNDVVHVAGAAIDDLLAEYPAGGEG